MINKRIFFKHGAAKAALCLLVLTTCLGLAACHQDHEAASLPRMKIDKHRIAVTGISSGAYMATQAHLAFSDHLIGAAMLAGGPYACAQASLDTALGPCMIATPSPPDAQMLATNASARMANGELAPKSGLAGDHVLLLHGTQDITVVEDTSHASADFYQALKGDPAATGLTISWDAKRNFNHTFPTLATGSDCGKSETPYLGNCGFDAAGYIVQQLFGIPSAIDPPSATGELRRFNQDLYLPDGKDAFLDDAGYAYLPKKCLQGKSCGLLIAFHGCLQNTAAIGEVFVRDAGFNRWADAADVIVLYPQTRSTYLPLNPKACWDWWGYSGAEYDTRKGVQLRWLAKATAALGAPLE